MPVFVNLNSQPRARPLSYSPQRHDGTERASARPEVKFAVPSSIRAAERRRSGSCGHCYIGEVCNLLLVKLIISGRDLGRSPRNTGNCSSCSELAARAGPPEKGSCKWRGPCHGGLRCGCSRGLENKVVENKAAAASVKKAGDGFRRRSFNNHDCSGPAS